ncbi:hypothetical protein FACS1894176_03060 [Bacteroidia bacterium]|nr:hypothetical protein FACS1894176_03060 [Bacteroidia bacterium]
MLQANKLVIRWSLLAAIAVISVIVIICLPIVGNKIDRDTFQSDTLFFMGKDASDNYLMYLLMEYKVVNKDSLYIKRTFVSKENTDNYHYFMVQKSDSLVLIRPVYEDEQDNDSVYIDLRTDKPTRVDYFLNRLNSKLQFVGYEQYEDRNGEQDSLIVMYGCDIGAGGCFEERYKHNWYFDRNFHLRKAATVNGFVFFIDKHYFGIE